ncbi:M24 family metallopeptidase, partial [Halovivax sp.]|uniref:M24 family metallopeptidase n=1 Tax=Halovivax sp. TaxID=1935978 RepID=UPI0025BDAEBD
AASAGLDRAASVLAGATVEDGRLRRDGAPLTAERLRRLADVAVVESGAVPAGSTRVETVGSPAPGSPTEPRPSSNERSPADTRSSSDERSPAEPRPSANGDGATGPDEPLRSGEPLVLELAPREPSEYRAGLVRTLVPGTDGGWERRAHVAVESALRSAKTMLAAGGATVDAVETELEAEVRSFGFGRGASGSVYGVGLEARERPRRGDHDIEEGAVLALRARAEREDGAAVELGDLLVRRDGDARWLSRPSRALDPSAVATP